MTAAPAAAPGPAGSPGAGTPTRRSAVVHDADLAGRITRRANVFDGKPIIRDMRIAVEHVTGMPASGDSVERSCTNTRSWNRRTSGRACSTPTAPSTAKQGANPLASVRPEV